MEIGIQLPIGEMLRQAVRRVHGYAGLAYPPDARENRDRRRVPGLQASLWDQLLVNLAEFPGPAGEIRYVGGQQAGNLLLDRLHPDRRRRHVESGIGCQYRVL